MWRLQTEAFASRAFLLLLFAVFGLTAGRAHPVGEEARDKKCSADDSSPVDTVRGVISRLLGASYVGNFSLCVLNEPDGSNDTFEVRQSPAGLIRVCGSNGVAMAKGVYWYLQTYCNASVTWGVDRTGDQLLLPQLLPAVPGTVRVTSTVKWRYYMNVCTVSYSSVWWGWQRWQREIDWMALHGINLPLAFTGQEYVLAEFYKQLGLTEEELQSYFTGPAFLAWNRMGNIRRWAGPLRPEWRQRQLNLQCQILSAMRSLGMTPVLPGFSGHVPEALARVFPGIKLTHSHPWGRFTNKSLTEVMLLDPTDPHFIPLAANYTKLQTNLMGTDHIYNIDTFNEMEPSSSDPSYLASTSRAVYSGLRLADDQAVWLMQGWLFKNTKFWNTNTVRAYLSGVPNYGMIILDLWTEELPLWSEYDSYYGKPFIWCTLHNFGGRRALYGNLTRIGTGPAHDRVAEGSTMVGVGITMEAIEQNPIIYELTLEMGWRSNAVIIGDWLEDYTRNRYGFVSKDTLHAWNSLLTSAYQFGKYEAFFGFIGKAPQIPHTDLSLAHLYKAEWTIFSSDYPRLKNVAKVEGPKYDHAGIVKSWRLLFNCAEKLSSLPGPLSYDLVDVGRQVLVDLHGDLLTQLNAAYLRSAKHHVNSTEEFLAISSFVLEIVRDLDRLLLTDRNYLLGSWLEGARMQALTVKDRRQYEENARFQITLWGPNGEVNDYAEKHWNGLVGVYYWSRWKVLIDEMWQAISSGRPTSETVLAKNLLQLGRQWCQNDDTYPTEPKGDVVDVTQALLAKWASPRGLYKKIPNSTVDLADLQFGQPMQTVDKSQLMLLCDINPRCVAFTSLGYLKSATSPRVTSLGQDMYIKLTPGK